MGEADHDDGVAMPREFRLTTRLFKKYGYTDGYPGCEHKESSGALYSRGHSTLCRQRLYNRLKDDDEELDEPVELPQVEPS